MPTVPAPAADAAVAGETAPTAANAVPVSPPEGAPAASAVARSAALAGAGPSAREPRAAGGPGVLVLSSFVVVMLVSYASAMTLLCVYLIATRPSTLDLPDLAPKKSKTKNASNFPYFPMEKEVLPANVMRLGESRQFGSVRVTPVRVTRGQVEFSFYKPGEDETRAPEGPVLKLHLRFDNVSRDQEFVPFDRQLVYTKVPDKQYGWFNPNNFVSNVSDRSERAKHVYVFDMPPKTSDWLMRDQNLDHELKPGDFVETFVPTTADDIETLSGDLVWRVQFRKGYNPKSLRGVTTLIEVLFKSSDIIDEPPAPPAADSEKAVSKDA